MATSHRRIDLSLYKSVAFVPSNAILNPLSDTIAVSIDKLRGLVFAGRDVDGRITGEEVNRYYRNLHDLNGPAPHVSLFLSRKSAFRVAGLT